MKTKKKWRRSKNNTTMHETIKMKSLAEPEIFIDEEGDALGIPKLWCLYFSDISWGYTILDPKLEIFSILHLITSFSLYTWNFSFIQNFTQSSLAKLVYSKDNRPLGLALEQNFFATVANPSKNSILGMPPRVTPRNIQEVQASKLGNAQGIPFFINKNRRSF